MKIQVRKVFVNYSLEINAVDGNAEHEFKAITITEGEFEQDYL